MASVRDLRSRIKSVGNIRQITRAMEMVATTKLRRFQERAVASRPYAREIAGLVGRLAALLGDDVGDRPLFKDGSGEQTAILLVTSDRGLCGAYNSNLFRFLEQWLREHPNAKPRFFVYGRKGYQYLCRRGREEQIERFLVEPVLEQTDYRAAARTSNLLVQAFQSGQYKEALILYTAFESMVRYVPTCVPLLPIRGEGLAPKTDVAKEKAAASAGDVILEPDAATIFDQLVPRYLETRVYNALLESLTSEYASRRFSMKNATDAAKGIQNVLKGKYNRKRQENITKDLLDIVGGAEALR